MQILHNPEDTQYVSRTFNQKYTVKVPNWQRLPGDTQAYQENCCTLYEPLRTASMDEHLKRGDVLFDIGVSDGWISAIYAQMVGAENMCMFEPSPTAWPTIRATWQANNLPTPKDTFCGFVSNQTNLRPEKPDHELGNWMGWPQCAYKETYMEEQQFRGVKDRAHDTPQTTLDEYVGAYPKNTPDGISIDVEGAELLVLRGAKYLLEMCHPKIWLSLHDVNGALTYDYKSCKEEVFAYLAQFGYKPEFLEIHGDSHWYCA